MTPFACGHAAHPDWRMALTMAAAQIDAQPRAAGGPTLGFVYFTDHYAAGMNPRALRDPFVAGVHEGFQPSVRYNCFGQAFRNARDLYRCHHPYHLIFRYFCCRCSTSRSGGICVSPFSAARMAF